MRAQLLWPAGRPVWMARCHAFLLLAVVLRSATALVLAPRPTLSQRSVGQLDALYPSVEESARAAASRKDGYWPYVSKKVEPPKEFTYGEFPLPLFGELVDRAACYAAACPDGRRSDAEFLDLGSGAGRLVLAAAAMSNPWKRCRGVEYLPSLHLLAEEKLSQANNLPAFLQSDVMLEESSWEAPGLDLSNVDVAFA
jgi:tRNA G46 methylase TrmB